MEGLKRIVTADTLEDPGFCLDRYQQSVLSNLYLEFFVSRGRVLITPSSSHFTIGRATAAEEEELAVILAESQDAIMRWKRYVVVNLALYTALLETNSYYLGLNDDLLICRCLGERERADRYVIKLYTIARYDLPARYADKLYLGRDHISSRSLRREQFGLPDIRGAVGEQFAKLRGRLVRLVPESETDLFDRQYLEDLEESLGELNRRTDELVADFPAGVFDQDLEAGTLLAASSHFRDIKHVLMEMDGTLQEMETTLLEDGHPRAARYVTKCRKDTTNYINFIMCKVNGRISNVVNRIDALAYFFWEAHS